MVTSGPPQDLDDETLQRIARSFYVVRMVRYGLLLLAALGFLAAAAAQDAPGLVVAGLAALVAGLAVAALATRRRYVRTRPPRGAGPASGSPTG